MGVNGLFAARLTICETGILLSIPKNKLNLKSGFVITNQRQRLNF